MGQNNLISYLKYNINLIYLVKRFINEAIIREKIKEIAFDRVVCLTEQELSLKRAVNSLNYIMNNINQPLKEEILIQSYFLLTNELLNKEIIDRVMKLYYRNIDAAPHSLAALLHLCIVNNISKKNVEFAFIISNYIMLKKDRWLLMPYEYCHNDYREAIVNNDLSRLIRVFYDIELVKKEKKPCLLSREGVIQNIKSIKEELVNNYYIEKLYLFGSFAKGTNNENSDIDFLVILDESLINIERLNQIELIKEYLSE